MDRPLRIALLTYRGDPHCGGQGVYVRHLSGALARLGHRVEVLSGPPYPEVPAGVRLHEVPSLGLYDPEDPFRPKRPVRGAVDALELALMSTGTLPEPLTFSLRAYGALRRRTGDFDVVHDNQCLGYGVLGLGRRLPVLGTIHHPITVDRRIDLAAARGPEQRRMVRRWYRFLGMQIRVARRLPRLLTISEASRRDIARDFRLDPGRLFVVPVGVDVETFRPRPGRARPGRIVTVTRPDMALKGFRVLVEAMAKLRTETSAELVVAGGRPARGGEADRALRESGLGDAVRFTGPVAQSRLVELYAEAEAAVVPSLYEGFSLPAIEAMACGVPLVATTGGALPEVVGDAGLLVPTGDPGALAAALARLLQDAGLRARLGAAGRARVLERFTWERTAGETVAHYHELLSS